GPRDAAHLGAVVGGGAPAACVGSAAPAQSRHGGSEGGRAGPSARRRDRPGHRGAVPHLVGAPPHGHQRRRTAAHRGPGLRQQRLGDHRRGGDRHRRRRRSRQRGLRHGQRQPRRRGPAAPAGARTHRRRHVDRRTGDGPAGGHDRQPRGRRRGCGRDAGRPRRRPRRRQPGPRRARAHLPAGVPARVARRVGLPLSAAGRRSRL
ncbi:MAG: hypothetical protein AVDCRST_MAG07-1969, partial [uncultured Frankineae bacterium]